MTEEAIKVHSLVVLATLLPPWLVAIQNFLLCHLVSIDWLVRLRDLCVDHVDGVSKIVLEYLKLARVRWDLIDLTRKLHVRAVFAHLQAIAAAEIHLVFTHQIQFIDDFLHGAAHTLVTDALNNGLCRLVFNDVSKKFMGCALVWRS